MSGAGVRRRSYLGCVDATALTPGEVMERARASQGLTIADVSAATRLRPGLLAEMEADDFHGTGGEVYARGHLKSIAAVLGIEPDVLLDAYAGLDPSRRPPAA